MTDAPPPKSTPARKPASAKTTAAKTTAVKRTAAKTTAAKRPATSTASTVIAPVAPVEPASLTAPAATAPAGWYQVSPGSPQQRYWDGSAWTEHLHDPSTVAAAQPAPAHHAPLRATEGTSATTVWFWLTVASLAISIAYWIVTQLYFDAQFASNQYRGSTSYADTLFTVSVLLGLVPIAAFIVFPVLDWLALRKRGVPKPFHWAWSLFAIVLSTPIVYVIGRAVVAKRRTGTGLAPLWVFIALQVITFIVALVVLVTVSIAIITQFANLFSDAGNIL